MARRSGSVLRNFLCHLIYIIFLKRLSTSSSGGSWILMRAKSFTGPPSLPRRTYLSLITTPYGVFTRKIMMVKLQT